jgi:hypothetical protein
VYAHEINGKTQLPYALYTLLRPSKRKYTNFIVIADGRQVHPIELILCS